MITLLASLVLLGVLITVHELGHFVLAKLSNVKVNLFSIGFGRALVKWKRGETEYRIAVVPFGGYVQMAGSDPQEERDPSEAGRSLLDKPPLTRLLIYLAGPAMNMILPFFLLVPLYFLGKEWAEVPANMVGAVDRGMPAGQPGKLQAGDRIVAIDGEPTYGFWQTQRALDAYSSRQGPLRLTVERGPEQTRVDVEVEPRPWSETHSMLGFGTDSYKMGFVVGFLTPDLAVTRPDGPVGQAGLRTFDRILKVNGQETPRYVDALWALAAVAPGGTATLEVERPTRVESPVNALEHLRAGPSAWTQHWPWRPPYLPKAVLENPRAQQMLPPEAPPGTPTWRSMHVIGQKGPQTIVWRHERLPLTLTAPPNAGTSDAVGTETRFGFEHASNCVSWVDPQGSAAQAASLTGAPDGLRAGDCIVEIDGATHSLSDFIAMRLGDKPENAKVVKVRREGQILSFQVRPEVLVAKDRLFGDTKQWDPGLILTTRPDWMVGADKVPNEARLSYAWSQAEDEIGDKLRETIYSVLGLFSGQVSPKQLSGPITIMYIAGKQAEQGLTPFLQLMVVISLGLSIFNLVPVPGLDGGHILVAAIEIVIRRRVPTNVQRAIQGVGIFVIVLLVLFVLTQDVGRFL